MFWSNKGSDKLAQRLAVSEAEVASLASEVRSLRAEMAETADRVYRHMKAAQGRARTALDATVNQGPAPRPDTPPSVPGGRIPPNLRRLRQWGARGRREMNGDGGEATGTEVAE